MDWQEREYRRRAMAKAVADGATLAAVAAQFGVTPATVRRGCEECGVDPKPRPLSPIVALKHLVDGKPPAEVATLIGATENWVAGVKYEAQQAGFEIGGESQTANFHIGHKREIRFHLDGEEIRVYLHGMKHGELAIIPGASNSCILRATGPGLR